MLTPPALTEISAFLLHDCLPNATNDHLVTLLQGELAKFRIPSPPTFSAANAGAVIEAALGDGHLVLEAAGEPLPVDPLLDLVAGLPDPAIFANAEPVLRQHVASTRLTLHLDQAHTWSTETTLAVVSHLTAVLAYALPTVAVYWPLSGYVLPTDAFADLAADDNLLFLNTRPQFDLVSGPEAHKPMRQLDLIGSEMFIGHRVRFVSAKTPPAEMISTCLHYLAACLERNTLLTSVGELGLTSETPITLEVPQEASGPDGFPVILLTDESAEAPAADIAHMSLRGSLADDEETSADADDAPVLASTSAVEPLNEDDRFHAEEDRMTSIAHEPDLETQSIAAEAATRPAVHSIEEDLADAAYSAADTDFQQMQAPRYGERVPSRAEKPIEPQKSNIAELRAFALASSVREAEVAARSPPAPNGLLGRLKDLLQRSKKAS